jgi:hypothetical protein
MMARARPEKCSRSLELFAGYTAKSPACLRAKYLNYKKLKSRGENEISRQKDGLGSACADVGRHRHACDRGIRFLFALDHLPTKHFELLFFEKGGRKMKQADYVRMAEKCAREANTMAPSPERDELLRKVKLFESYAKIDNWIASPGLQPPN